MSTTFLSYAFTWRALTKLYSPLNLQNNGETFSQEIKGGICTLSLFLMRLANCGAPTHEYATVCVCVNSVP